MACSSNDMNGLEGLDGEAAPSPQVEELPAVLREVYLGFLDNEEKCDEDDEDDEPEEGAEEEKLYRSKVGGYVDWLAKLSSPPLCPGTCRAPMPLFVQIYAPLDAVNPNAYHRFLYVFACPSVRCHDRASPYAVLRYQQPRSSARVPLLLCPGRRIGDSQLAQLSALGPLCPVCGHAAPMRCGRCKAQQYCSREHQVKHWKGGHSTKCSPVASSPAEEGKQPEKEKGGGSVEGLLDGWPSFEICTESEKELLEAAEDSMQQRLRDQKIAIQGAAQALKNEQKGVDVRDEDFEQNKEHIDKQTLRFQQRVSVAPDQVLRYGHPVMWVHSSNQPLPSMIPDCANCGSPRRYEYQILPQLLYYLRVDHKSPRDSAVSINFSTIAVYTCSASCDPPLGLAYSPEFLWIQHE